MSLISSIMNMTADVFVQQNAQSESGAITREWIYDKNIQCKIMPASGRSSSLNDNKRYDNPPPNDYQENLRLDMKCLVPISKRWRITNIRTNDGQKVYVELDKIDEPDTIFDVVSSHAVLDPFGKISHYTVQLQRVLVQNDKTYSN